MPFEFATVMAITVLCYLAGAGVKVSKIENKWIPIICGVVGLVLGIAGLYISIPDFPASDPISAAAVGAASGLAATGVNEAIGQLTKSKE